MLFKQKHLEGIRSGIVTLAFRRWKKPSAKAGSLIKTSIGLVSIDKISTVKKRQIRESDAQQAGFDTREELMNMLDQYAEGDIYKIVVHYHAADPRIALRQQSSFTDESYTGLKTKLERMDQYNKTGPWTMAILQAIKANPKLKAADLALQTGKTKEWLKLNVRKLKNLGLTISHDPGYEISPLGLAFLKKKTKDQ